MLRGAARAARQGAASTAAGCGTGRFWAWIRASAGCAGLVSSSSGRWWPRGCGAGRRRAGCCLHAIIIQHIYKEVYNTVSFTHNPQPSNDPSKLARFQVRYKITRNSSLLREIISFLIYSRVKYADTGMTEDIMIFTGTKKT